MEAANSEARCHGKGLAAKQEFLRGELRAQPLHCQPDVFFVHVRQHQQEFVAAHAPADIRRARIVLQDFGELLQNLIPRVVAIRIVHALEAIQVRMHNPERISVARGAPPEEAPPNKLTPAGGTKSKKIR